MSSLPLVMGPNGPVPTSADTLRQIIEQAVAATNPDYTANLPGSLIEDILSTQVGGLTQADQARVDAINSVTPYGANAFILGQLGPQLGIAQGAPTNTSVYVVFTGTAGYVIPPGFIVSDGTYQYVIQSGGVVGTGGTTSQLYAVASQSGTWAVPAGTVTQIVTSVASGYTLTVTNPEAGTPSTGSESVESYRARVLEAQKVTAQGVATFITTLVKDAPGVTPRLVTVLQVPGGWEVNGSDISLDDVLNVGIVRPNLPAVGAAGTFAVNTRAVNTRTARTQKAAHTLEIVLPSSTIAQQFAALLQQGYLPLPFQVAYRVSLA